MSQKSSVPQAVSFVSQVLKRDKRQTQYDLYFTDMTTEPAEARGEIQGASLWSYMASKAETVRHAE